jgi:hypothetical protein
MDDFEPHEEIRKALAALLGTCVVIFATALSLSGGREIKAILAYLLAVALPFLAYSWSTVHIKRSGCFLFIEPVILGLGIAFGLAAIVLGIVLLGAGFVPVLLFLVCTAIVLAMYVVTLFMS